MRRAAAVAVVLCLSALAAQHAAAVEPACADGFDNDMDGRVDWPADPGCTGPGDPDERPCSLGEPDQCTAELQPCVGMLPPTGLHATWTEGGVALDWREPLSGAPPVYLVFRVQVGVEPGPGGVTLSILDQVSPNALPFALTQDIAPPGATVHLLGRLPGRGLTVVAPLDAGTVVPEPIDSVPGSLTTYFDATAEPAADYVYWVEGAAAGCRGPASNAAFSGLPLNIPPRIEDCWWPQPPDLDWPPSADCLGSNPVIHYP